MKPLFWLFCALLVLAWSATETPARSKRVVLERAVQEESKPAAAGKRWGPTRLHAEFKTTMEKARSIVETSVRTFLTVAGAMVQAARTVVVSVGKLIVRLGVSLVFFLGQWLIGLLL